MRPLLSNDNTQHAIQRLSTFSNPQPTNSCMAKYQIPPDPRDPNSDYKPARHYAGNGSSEPTPWLWLGLGLLVTFISLLVAFVIINVMLSREPLPISGAAPPAPTIIRLTAPPTLSPSPTADLPTPTAIPTLTPQPTPDRSEAPAELTVEYYARVTNTDGIGVSVRGGPSTANVRVFLAEEGATLLLIDGPVENEGFLWWQVRLADGTEGWVAGDFLEPAAAPENQ